MSLPTFLIIGAMKAGTSSLHNYLSMHPDIFMSKDKELNFFNTSLNWHKGVDWYKEQFDDAFKVRGETSPNYAKWDGTAQRIHAILPNIKLIYLLRDPVNRFVSQCNHAQVDPNQLVNDLKHGSQSEIFTNGLYSKWYQEYLSFFPKERILVVTSEALRSQKKETLNTIFNFLEVNPNHFDFAQQRIITETHITSEKKTASESIQTLNQHKGFLALKKMISPWMPILKPLWHNLFYKKRIMRRLTPENGAYLKHLYQPDLQQLADACDINYYEPHA